MTNSTLSAAFKKYQTIILPIVAVIIAIALFALIVVPQALKIPDTVSQINTANNQLQGLNTKVATLQQVDPDKYKSDLDTTFAALPQDPDIAGVFNQILNTLNANGLVLDGVDSNQVPDPNNNNMVAYLLKVDTSGPTSSLISFMDQIKKIPRVVNVQAFDSGLLTAQTQTGSVQSRPASQSADLQNNQSLTINVTIETYYQGVPKTQNLQTEAPVKLPTAADQQMIQTIKDEINAQPVPASVSSGPSGRTDPFEGQ